jgi:hypothetical protein
VEGVKPTRKRGRTNEGGGYEDVEFLDSLPDDVITPYLLGLVTMKNFLIVNFLKIND